MLEISSTSLLLGVLENENGEVNRARPHGASCAILQKLDIVLLVVWEPLKATIGDKGCLIWVSDKSFL